MITIDSYPDTICLAGNKQLVEATGNKMYTNPGAYATLHLYFGEDEAIVNGSYITLSWGVNTITIYFRTTLMGTGYEYLATAGMNDGWLTGLCNYLRTIYALDGDFTFVYDLNQFVIKIKAKEKSSDSSLVIVENIATASLTYYNSAGVTPVTRDGFRLLFQLFRSTNGNLVDDENELLGEEAITPDALQKVTFDMSEYLWNALDKLRSGAPGFNYPIQSDKIWEHQEQVLQYFIRYAEMYDSFTEPLASVDSIKYALMGGLSKMKEKEFTSYGTTFVQMLEDEMFFLTWAPISKVTSTSTPERLYFFLTYNTIIFLYAKCYFEDGTSSADILIDDFDASQGYVYELDVSSVIFPESTSPINYYEIWLVNDTEQAGNMSEVRTFVMYHNQYRSVNNFMFRNSQGGYDKLRCTGRLHRHPEIERDLFTDGDNERKVMTGLMDPKYTISTGSLTGDEARWLEDFMISTEHYWLLNNRSVPIIITSKKMTQLSDDQRRFTLTFEFSVSALEEFYATPQELQGVIGSTSANNNNNNYINA